MTLYLHLLLSKIHLRLSYISYIFRKVTRVRKVEFVVTKYFFLTCGTKYFCFAIYVWSPKLVSYIFCKCGCVNEFFLGEHIWREPRKPQCYTSEKMSSMFTYYYLFHKMMLQVCLNLDVSIHFFDIILWKEGVYEKVNIVLYFLSI
jgi:hypothetical protein